MTYLLDTNICIALLKGREASLVKKFKVLSSKDFALCSVVKAELLYGARKSQHVNDNLILLERFFAQFHSYPFDDAAAEHYGTLRAILEKAGTPVGANDLLIAAIAQVNDLTIITRNVREFSRVPSLRWEQW